MPKFLSESEHEDSWSHSSSDYGNNQQEVDEDTTQKQRELINVEEDDGQKSRRCRRGTEKGDVLGDSEVELASNKRSFSTGGINEGYGKSQPSLKDEETVEGVADSIDDGAETDGTVDSRKFGLHGGGLNSKNDSQIIEREEEDKEHEGQGGEHSSWRTGLWLKRPDGKGAARACEDNSANSWVGAETREENGPREEVTLEKNQKEDLKDKAENSNKFWEGFESEEGSEKEWMGRTTLRDKKRRRKRAKSCSLVYQKSTKLGQFHQKKRGRGRSNSRETKGEVIPKFLPGTSNSVAGGSIGDNGIENCNRLLKTQLSRKSAKDLWDFAKQLGVIAENEEVMIKNLEEMENRDRKAKAASLDKKGCGGEQVQLTEEEINRRKEALLDLWKNMNTKERMAQQKSRKTWLANGDANTKFFHNCVKGKWKITEINSIQIKDSQLVEPTTMKEEIANFFENMFKEENCERPKLEGISFQQITEQENASLIVRKEWETIKGDVIGFIKEFQEKGELVRGLNSSFIVLVPKVNNPQRIEEYRPISLIGAVYKILAKLLANRLKKVLDQVIGKQQMAFISGRQLMDGVVIANEVVDEAKKKKRKSFLFKIDFEKAYDKVCWKFLECMMQKLGFCDTWRRWIMECLRTSQVSVLVNGSPTRQFNISQGLRQGDPLSPFLFLIVAEGLNGMITTVVQKGLMEGVEVGSKGFKVSHLQFADDTILFGSATEQNVWAMKGIMRSFELVSGLKVNFNKSQLLGIAVNEEWLDKMAWVLCCRKDFYLLVEG
ncbi:hypothetical protein SLEP1_g17092 [Rubroshorea leprosula]|uniref:Reverse transcriptase domain-containing protein n=1 Tax=Rubroshorea leprosula TaxID=152421 RepID=A0AAV5J0R3_9ROSI|nr:hypothetical protein SLEP1_g17092 [Rubroshorea leprosula]